MADVIGLHLKPQEIAYDHRDSNCRFVGQLVSTPAALEVFGPLVIAAAQMFLRSEATKHDGIDYLQVFENDGDGPSLWVIDDRTHVTALLPSDY